MKTEQIRKRLEIAKRMAKTPRKNDTVDWAGWVRLYKAELARREKPHTK